MEKSKKKKTRGTKINFA